MIKVLVVDDSALMRNIIKEIIESDPDFSVVGTAKNGKEAVELNDLLRPDIVTMDIEMPILDGIEATHLIMEKNPSKIVILSAFASDDATPTLQALKNGAVDFLQKPSGVISPNIRLIKFEIVEKLKEISKISVDTIKKVNENKIRKIENIESVSGKCIAIASSTGGPKALEKLIPALPAKLGGFVFIVQHMPQTFTKSFALRMDKLSDLPVKEVEQDERLSPSTVYIGKGDLHFKVKSKGGQPYASLSKDPPLWGVRPAADYLFDSVAQVFKENTLGLVLTGMGRDGTQGAAFIRRAGGKIIIQSKESAFIWGMPGSIFNAGHYDWQLPLEEMPGVIEDFFRR